MNKLRPNIFLVEPLSSKFEEIIICNAALHRFSAFDEATLVSEAGTADAIVIRAKGRITRKVIESAPLLKVIGMHGVGVDHIDLNAARERRVTVVNSPLANYRSTAEFTVALMFAVARKIVQADVLVREERPWSEADKLTGIELRGKTLGVVGMGRVGKTVAEICASAFEMRILYHDYKNRIWEGQERFDANLCSLDELFSDSDIITLHVPSLAATKRMISRDHLSRMKPSAFLINTARGSIIDQEFLVELLQANRIMGAALDVMESEPLVGSPLQSLSNVVLTPHMASYTRESVWAMGEVVYDVLRVLNGETPKYRVV